MRKRVSALIWEPWWALIDSATEIRDWACQTVVGLVAVAVDVEQNKPRFLEAFWENKRH